MPASVLIDTDPGIDDAVAIAYAARIPGLRIVAITTVHGNADIDRVTRNARYVAKISGLTVPIVAGAGAPLVREPSDARGVDGAEGLGYVIPPDDAEQEPDGAAEMIITQVRSNHKLAICCLGPLTNLATAIAFAPDIAEAVGPVFVMGGVIDDPGTQTPTSEFNWWSDPEAADFVLHAGLDLRVVPIDVTRRIAIPGSAIRTLEKAGLSDETAHFWANALRFRMKVSREREQYDGCIINDALAVALLADHTLADWEEMRIEVSLSDDEHRGAVIHSATGARVAVAMRVRAAEVLEKLERAVFARWLPNGSLAPGAEDAKRLARARASKS